jgi:phenol hydroxylase P1 protein
MVVKDWFETYVAQNVVLDGLLYPLVYRHIDQRLSRQYGPGLGMLNEFASSWFDESNRWVDATLKTAASESAENAALLGQWIAKWRPRVLDALHPLAAAALGGEEAGPVLREIADSFDARVSKQGVPLASATEANHG